MTTAAATPEEIDRGVVCPAGEPLRYPHADGDVVRHDLHARVVPGESITLAGVVVRRETINILVATDSLRLLNPDLFFWLHGLTPARNRELAGLWRHRLDVGTFADGRLLKDRWRWWLACDAVIADWCEEHGGRREWQANVGVLLESECEDTFRHFERTFRVGDEANGCEHVPGGKERRFVTRKTIRSITTLYVGFADGSGSGLRDFALDNHPEGCAS